MKKIISLLMFMLIISSIVYAKSGNITFGWDHNEEIDLAGYNLYKSQTPGTYIEPSADTIMADANQHVYQTEVINGVPLYFVLTAFDDAGNESGYSNEVEFIYIDTNAPVNPKNFKITVTVIIEQ